MAHTPVFACDPAGISIHPQHSSSHDSHRLDCPAVVVSDDLKGPLAVAADHLHAGRTVSFPTETVYGLGANSLNPDAIKRIYTIKQRPADNPLIIHVSSLDMLRRMLPESYTLSPLYLALVDEFWPGPLTLLFPNPNPPPFPAPQTLAIRMPNHPLALALIATADLPVSAPSANSSGRPSPTRAAHVANDIDGAEGLGCILDGGACGVGVESTVLDGLGWTQGGGGVVNILRPGGTGVEDVARVVAAVDAQYGGETAILVHGKPWYGANGSNGSGSSPTSLRRPSLGSGSSSSASPTLPGAPAFPFPMGDRPPSTPGVKYRHYSPSVPVYLFLPSNVFPRPPALRSATSLPVSVIQALASRIVATRPTRSLGVPGTPTPVRIGFLHYADSPLHRAVLGSANQIPGVEIVCRSLGADATSAAAALFDGMLALEADSPNFKGVDVILIEGCSDEGLGLAVMERIGKAVGGGGVKGELGNGQVRSGGEEGRFWVQV